MVTAAMKLKVKKSCHQQKQRCYFANKGLSSQSYGFSSSHVWMWELDHESWALKNWCFLTVVLENTLENPLDCKVSNQSILKEISPILNIYWKDWCWSWDSNILATWYEELTHCKRVSWIRERSLMLGKIESGEMGMTGDETVGWHHRLVGQEFEQALGVSDGQGSLACFSPWGCRESDKTEQLNWQTILVSCTLVAIAY